MNKAVFTNFEDKHDTIISLSCAEDSDCGVEVLVISVMSGVVAHELSGLKLSSERIGCETNRIATGGKKGEI